jgi:hypothetical protein
MPPEQSWDTRLITRWNCIYFLLLWERKMAPDDSGAYCINLKA